MSNVLFDFPAYSIIVDLEREFVDGDEFAVPFFAERHGWLMNFYKLGSIEGYALKYGEDVDEAVARCKQNMLDDPGGGYEMFWANAMSVVIHNRPVVKKVVPGFAHYQVIRFKGKRFQILPDWNRNVKLVEVVPGAALLKRAVVA